MDNTTSSAPSASKMRGWLIAAVIVVLLALYFVAQFNGLTVAKENVDNQWAQVEAQYQRRMDLIPNLVESTKGVMKQEQEVFGKLADARTRYANAATVDEKAVAAGEVETALSRLLVVMENYPQLKSSDTMQILMAQLEGTENRVAVERGRYNDAVKSYNLATKRFPGNIFARFFGFQEHAYFDAAPGSEQVPKVSF